MKSHATIESEIMNALHKVARRLLWWKTPEAALTDTHRLLAQVMTYGALSDVQVALERYGRTAFLETLLHAPPGVFDARSWRYWHLMFARPVPPLPVRIVTAGH